jgi:hypothetical protein
MFYLSVGNKMGYNGSDVYVCVIKWEKKLTDDFTDR